VSLIQNGSAITGGLFQDATTGTNTGIGATRTSSGGTVAFNFFGSPSVAPGQTSYVFLIKTDALGYKTGQTTVSNGADGTFSGTFAPTPEPASVLLLGGCFAGLGLGYVYRRARRVRPAVS
jgi:hypothetical protein